MTITLIGSATPAPFAEKARASDVVIAVDGGANHCADAGVMPHVVIGDFDSVRADVRGVFPDAQWIEDADQDVSDLQKALAAVAHEPADQIHLFGFTSHERFDHSLMTLQLMRQYANMPLTLHAPGWTARYIIGATTLDVQLGDTVSFVPLSEVSGVHSSGFEWELSDDVLRDRVMSLSNVVSSLPCTVTVERGGLLCITNV